MFVQIDQKDENIIVSCVTVETVNEPTKRTKLRARVELTRTEPFSQMKVIFITNKTLFI